MELNVFYGLSTHNMRVLKGTKSPSQDFRAKKSHNTLLFFGGDGIGQHTFFNAVYGLTEYKFLLKEDSV